MQEEGSQATSQDPLAQATSQDPLAQAIHDAGISMDEDSAIWQPCPTNPEVLRITRHYENLIRELKEQHTRTYRRGYRNIKKESADLKTQLAFCQAQLEFERQEKNFWKNKAHSS